MATFTGTVNNDTWTVVRAATFSLDGLDGTDTLSLGTSLRSAYTITRAADGAVLIDSVSGASGGALHATLYNMEILTFNNGRDTLDLRTYFGDTTAPTLASASPVDDASNVAVGANIVLTFSETIARGSGTVTIKDSTGATVASYDAASSSNLSVSGSTLTINPTSDLSPGTGYTVTVSAGAIKDTAGNSYAGLSGYNFTTVARSVTGTAGNDTLTAPSGLSTIDGAAGVDTVVLGSARSGWVVKATAGGFTVTGATSTVQVQNVERLQFSDQKLALDLAGNAGTVAKVLGAAFGADAVHNTGYVGIGLQYADTGMSEEALMQLALDARLGAGASNSTVVSLLYTNVVGSAPTASALATYVALLDNHTYTPASLGVMAAELSLNTTHIDLTGLASTGLAYTS